MKLPITHTAVTELTLAGTIADARFTVAWDPATQGDLVIRVTGEVDRITITLPGTAVAGVGRLRVRVIPDSWAPVYFAVLAGPVSSSVTYIGPARFAQPGVQILYELSAFGLSSEYALMVAGFLLSGSSAAIDSGAVQALPSMAAASVASSVVSDTVVEPPTQNFSGLYSNGHWIFPRPYSAPNAIQVSTSGQKWTDLPVDDGVNAAATELLLAGIPNSQYILAAGARLWVRNTAPTVAADWTDGGAITTLRGLERSPSPSTAYDGPGALMLCTSGGETAVHFGKADGSITTPFTANIDNSAGTSPVSLGKWDIARSNSGDQAVAIIRDSVDPAPTQAQYPEIWVADLRTAPSGAIAWQQVTGLSGISTRTLQSVVYNRQRGEFLISAGDTGDAQSRVYRSADPLNLSGFGGGWSSESAYVADRPKTRLRNVIAHGPYYLARGQNDEAGAIFVSGDGAQWQIVAGAGNLNTSFWYGAFASGNGVALSAEAIAAVLCIGGAGVDMRLNRNRS